MSQYKLIISGDKSIFYEKSDDGVETQTSKEFKFLGFFNSIHPYFRAQLDFIVKVLASKNIFLNVVEVPTQDDMCDNINKGYLDVSDLKFSPKFKVSSNGICYYLLQDEEMGRGWAVLSKQDTLTGETEILIQEHRDNVRDWLFDGEFIRSFGIDFETQYQE